MVKSNINSILLHFVLVLVVVVFILFPTSSLALSLPSSLSVPSSLPLSISSRTTSISITRRSFSPMLMFTNPTRARFGSSTSTMMLHSISRSISSNISSSISSSISSNNKSNSNISNRSRLCTKKSDTFTMSSFLSSRQSSSSTSLKAIHESKKNGMQEQNSDNGDNNGDEISFEFESLDKKGQWMTIDYDNIPIGKQKQTNIKDNIDNTNTNNNTNKNNTNNNNNKLQITFAPENPSPVDTKIINNYNKIVHIKRDDLLHLRKSNVSGNKARKMIALNELHINDFPDVVVSYGGPQSNAMVALAAIVQSKNINIGFDEEEENGGDSSSSSLSSSLVDEIESDGWIISDEQYDHNLNNDDDSDNGNNDNGNIDNGNNDNDNNISTTKPKRFIYYTKKLPRYLRNQPNGNLLRALSLGMEIVQLHHETYNKLFGGDHGGSSIPPTDIEAPVPGSSLWVPQGGACGLASQGAKFMADEIVSFWEERGKGMPLSVCIPGGTCTTAMLLSREINSILKNRESIRNNADGNNGEEILDIEVVVIPSVGDAGYAFRQMRALDLSTGGNGRDDIPQILKPKRRKNYYRFGEPNAEILKTFIDMQNENDLYLDLLYGAPAWNIIIQNWEAEKYNYDNYDSPIKGRQLMYVHSGGLEGVSSQLTRYKHKGLIDSGQVQS